MSLQNRVDPWGRLHAVPERGAWMGNRGILHDENRRVVSHWKLRAWITCVLQFRGRQRTPFSPRRYSELFFLDEATAFAAGHRPCAECRRARYNEFKAAWLAANPSRIDAVNPKIGEIDRILHAERVQKSGGKISYEAPYGALPPGTMIEHDAAACLVWGGGLHRWSFAGYARMPAVPSRSDRVRVLTPASVVRLFAAGFVPQVHDSAGARGDATT